MITIKIPPPDTLGLCDYTCPFISMDDDPNCNLGLDEGGDMWERAHPGPACAPGEYVLVPKTTWEAYDHTMRVLIVEGASPRCVDWARRALGEEVQR